MCVLFTYAIHYIQCSNRKEVSSPYFDIKNLSEHGAETQYYVACSFLQISIENSSSKWEETQSLNLTLLRPLLCRCTLLHAYHDS